VLHRRTRPPPISLVDQLGDRELAGGVDADDQAALEERPAWFVAINIGQPKDAVSPEASVQR
jgi:hypothetical protein